MNISLDKNNGVPLYIQVKNQILNLIKEDTLKVGSKMPTERELSQELKVSRNTVSSAYNDLEKMGVLKSIQGKGTFVAEENVSWKNENNQNKVLKFIDLAVEEALSIGMGAEELLDIMNKRVRKIADTITVGFVECNMEQSIMFSHELSQSGNMNVLPFIVSDFENMKEETKEKLDKCKIMIASFNHVNEVGKLLDGYDKEILGVGTNPDIGSIVKMARHPRDTRFAFICISEKFVFKVKGALENAGLSDLAVEFFTGTEEQELQALIDRSHVLVVSPGRLKDVSRLNNKNKETIVFEYTLDEESIKTLKSRIIEIKYEKNINNI